MRIIAISAVVVGLVVFSVPTWARTCTEQSQRNLPICETANKNSSPQDRVDCKKRMAEKHASCLQTGNWPGANTNRMTFEKR